MDPFRLVFFMITINVVISVDADKTGFVLPEPKNFKFEDELNAQSYGHIRFEDQNRYNDFDGSQNAIEGGQRIKFEDERFGPQDNIFQEIDNQNSIIDEEQMIKFQEDKRINKRPNHQKKKRRRRPKRLPNSVQGSGYPTQYQGSPVYPGFPAYPGPPVFGPGPIYPGQTPYPPQSGSLYKPRPSATSAALSAVTKALTSIALYDDAQCVPRMLCEAAGGGTLPGSGLLQSVAGLQPLLTLLSAYNGISSSPLFVFGRAVFLGMTSRANPGTCRYAYPQCPNDPEQLVHYLNNHNGGFFRFFAAPPLNQQQGLEQFYNQLSGQNYGFYQPQQPLQPNQLQNQNPQQAYGLQQNYPHQPFYGQQFGQYQPQQLYQNQNSQAGYGLSQQYFNQNYQRPNPYGKAYGLYGQSYPYQRKLNNSETKIQKRIQNVRNTFLVNYVSPNPKWLFPEDATDRDFYNNVRLGKVLKFPQSNVNSITAAEGFIFPGAQSNRKYPIDSIESDNSSFEQIGFDGFRFYNQMNDATVDDNSKGGSDMSDDSSRVLYIVRGNGDPNHPEIVRLAPGQSL